MALYCLFQLSVKDAEKMQEYSDLARETIEKFGVEICAFDFEPQAIEGAVDHNETGILRFENEEAFKKWYYSPEYQKAASVRLNDGASEGRVLLIRGFEGLENVELNYVD